MENRIAYRKEINIIPGYLDAMQHVNNVWYVQWMQDVAIEHSTAQGWGTQQYLDFGAAWFVRRHTIDYIHPLKAGDTVVVETWVQEMKHVSCLRQYRFTRAADNEIIATAETKWGLVSLSTGRPTRIPAEMLERFTSPF
ncbi:MAG: thioesterase family protein [Planctomycetia bacterium]|nr:thioesterase family protein [Planctomycetia bacterium]